MEAWGFPYLHSVPVVQRPRTPPFQGENTGSNPVGDANKLVFRNLKLLNEPGEAKSGYQNDETV